MSIAGIRQGATNLLALQNLRAGKTPVAALSGETQRQALELLVQDKPVLVGDIWPVPLPEQARAYAPRPGIESIKEAVAAILREAQAIPREKDPDAGPQNPDPDPPSLDKNV